MITEDSDSLKSSKLPSHVFRSDPAAGRLLARLYGIGKITARCDQRRKVRHQPKPIDRPQWKNVNNKWVNRDPQTSDINKMKALSVAVPTVGKKPTIGAIPIDTIPRRKSQIACQEAIECNELLNRKYRPPFSECILCRPGARKKTYEEEKTRLSDLFSKKCGNGLPWSIDHSSNDNLSCNQREEIKDNLQLSQRKQSRRMRITSDSTIHQCTTHDVDKDVLPATVENQLQDQIINEIIERKDFQRSLQLKQSFNPETTRNDPQSEMGMAKRHAYRKKLSTQLERQIDSEINARLNELGKIDPKLLT